MTSGLLAQEKKEEAIEHNRETLLAFKELGGSTEQYVRERRGAMNRIVADV